MLLAKIDEICRAAVKKTFDFEPARVSVEFSDKFGDLAFNCFHLAKSLRQAPPKIAAALAEHLVVDGLTSSAEATSGYVNITLVDQALFSAAITPALADAKVVGRSQPDDNSKTLMVEFSSPNTNKPQHLGHVRNDCLGDSIARILTAVGNKVVRANVVNDRGIHICKSMLAYQREGEGKTPESSGTKGDHLVGDYYVLFEKKFRAEMATYLSEHPEQENLSREDFFKLSEWGQSAQEMLKKWEAGDEEVVALWKLMNSWVMAGFKETYAALGIAFDRYYLESETYQLGKEIIEEGLRRGVFYKREDNAIEINLSAEKLDKKVVLRADGTSVYITQDIGATQMKAEEFGLDGQVFVVGDEQIYHFKVLFSILKKLGFDWAENLKHLAYGMVNLPDGKMKSREGTVVDADDLINEVTTLALKEISARDATATGPEVEERARRIGLAALRFMILNVSPQTTMTYDPKASVAFDGDTGPYVLYAFARIRRMIEDSDIDETKVTFEAAALGDPSERKLALKLLQFRGVIERAARDWNPAQISNYLLQLARAYHSHNRAVKILKAEDPKQRQARLALSLATANTLAGGLDLLGIQTVDRM